MLRIGEIINRRIRRLYILAGSSVVVVGTAVGSAVALAGSGSDNASQCPAAKVASCRSLQAQYHGQPQASKSGAQVVTPPPGQQQHASGITETRQSADPSLAFVQENVWDGTIAGTHMSVGAGSVASTTKTPTGQGELVVIPAVLGSPHPQQIFDDNVAGPFRIVAANGAVLTVQGAAGGRFTFNVSNGVVSANQP